MNLFPILARKDAALFYPVVPIMTKRICNYNFANGKKPKLEDEDAWPEDDLDPAALEKCFELASQAEVGPSQLNNLSILPDYNVFRNPSKFSTSTQVRSAIATTSKSQSVHELEVEIKQLQDRNIEKDGEISILRSKIKENTKIIQIEQQKITNEWRDKFIVSQKDLKSVQSKLEFKDLEIVNLKQQLADLRRINQESWSNTQIANPPKSVVKVNYERLPPRTPLTSKNHTFTEVILEKYYPLKSLTPNLLTDIQTESHIIINTSFKTSRNSGPYLQNQQTSNEATFSHKCPRLGDKKVGLDDIYCDFIKMISSDTDELNRHSQEAVHKTISVLLILLEDLNSYLVELSGHLRTEDIQQADMNYLLCGSKNAGWKRSQLGIQASKVLHIVSKLLLHNTEIADFICRGGCLKLLTACKEYAKLIPHRNGAVQGDYYLLRLLLKIVSSIGKYRLTDQTEAFLVSTTGFLKAIAMLEHTNNNVIFRDLFCKIFKEIVLIRPGPDVIKEITFLLNTCAGYDFFIQFLFAKNDSTELIKSGPRGVLYISQGKAIRYLLVTCSLRCTIFLDVCCFCLLAILLKNYLLSVDKWPLEVSYNMLCFIDNTYKTSHWIHHEGGDNICVCLSQLYKIEIEFVFRGLNYFIESYNMSATPTALIRDAWSGFLNHEITQKVLSQMNFNNFELIEKYVVVFSQYKAVEKQLKDQGIASISWITVIEELPSLSHMNFNSDF
ncbi:uncharacterized protein [Euwallacea fornicatus]|uniref:uncharacterized protein isoform X2 n=1 Tax=Euwallacea fornicatus TaxID=995702 RepID=UPI00338E4EF4